ncbi:hypothetical protein [uncultured Nocardioides sp.]|uniref:hypothetical protein n=1 Tax=uncultured Nocardioides sp. TaxID=198441 RepID=UPI0026053E4D|nr:hypothetical protein [uncultured Nocardioides sp.]
MRQPVVTLASTLIGAPLIITVAIYFAATDDPTASWGPWLLVVPVLNLAGIVAAELVGYTVPAIPAGTGPEQARRLAADRFRTGMILRFALTEAPFVVAVALSFAFAVPQPVVLVGLSAALTCLGLAFHCWPWSRPVTKTAEVLEADGVKTSLREDLSSVTMR